MVGVCNQCGLPEDLCVCDVIVKEQQKIEVKMEKRKFGKKYTIVTGFEKEVDVPDLAKQWGLSLEAAGRQARPSGTSS